MWRSVASNALSVLIVGFLIVAGVGIYFQNQFSAAGPLTEAMCVEVERGSNMTRVSEDLEKANAITSAALFRIGAEYAGKSASLKAGSFLVPEQASMEEIVQIVTQGGASTCGAEIVYRVGIAAIAFQLRTFDASAQRLTKVAEFAPSEEAPSAFKDAAKSQSTRHRIAMAEGVTSWQVKQALDAIDILTGEIELPAEGVLLPDSYEIRAGDTRQSVVDRMVEAQSEELMIDWATRAKDLPYNTPQEALIMASIIEKETALAEERGLVASVFVNRLKRGMPLQTDPTVIYGLTKGQGTLGRGLRRSELQKDTPWNTYTNRGLPPTPIANPGRDSIKAALNPEESGYFYFVADGTGGHAFAKTLAEHNNNVAKWRAIEAERASD